jgi:hypothetical protein
MSRTPSAEKGTYQNYVSHLKHIYGEAVEVYDTYSSSSYLGRFTLLGKTTVDRFRVSKAFHDRYDIADEAFGATVVPFALGLLGTVTTLLAIWELVHLLAIKVGLVSDDHKSHADRAAMFLLAGVAVSLSSTIIFLKSTLSLLSRSILTAIYGWNEPTMERFSEGTLDVGDIASNAADAAVSLLSP